MDNLEITLLGTKKLLLHSRTKQLCYALKKLQFYLLHGMKKVHRVLELEQEFWMKPYIRMNPEFQKRATNDFEKDFYKLMNNLVFWQNHGKPVKPC